MSARDFVYVVIRLAGVYFVASGVLAASVLLLTIQHMVYALTQGGGAVALIAIATPFLGIGLGAFLWRDATSLADRVVPPSR